MNKRTATNAENSASKRKKFDTIWEQFDQLRQMIQSAEESETYSENCIEDDEVELEDESVMTENSNNLHHDPEIFPMENSEVVFETPGTSSRYTNVLGELPSVQLCAENDLHEQLTIRWTNYIQVGLTKDKKEEILEKYPFFKNCPALKAPELNPELLTCMDNKGQRTDKFMSTVQDQIGHGLVAIGQQMSQLLKDEGNESVLGALADSAQLFCNVHHALSTHRKFNMLPFLNYDCRKLAEASKPDEFLLGQKFFEEVKNKEALKRAGNEMKAPSSSVPAKNQTTYPKTGGGRQYPAASRTPNNHLNWRRYPQKSKMKTPLRNKTRTPDKLDKTRVEKNPKPKQ